MEKSFFDETDDYLNGKLEGAALEKFMQKMSEDKELAEEFRLYRFSRTKIKKFHAQKDERNRLYSKKFLQRKNIPHSSPSLLKKIDNRHSLLLKRYVAILAACFLLLVSFFFLRNLSSLNISKLYSENREESKLSFIPRMVLQHKKDNTKYDLAIQNALKTQDFKTALLYLDSAKANFKKNMPEDKLEIAEIDYFRGRSYLELNEFEKAADALAKSAQVKDYQYSESAKFNLAICYLKEGRLDESIFHLQDLKNSNEYKNKVKRLKKQLKLLKLKIWLSL